MIVRNIANRTVPLGYMLKIAMQRILSKFILLKVIVNIISKIFRSYQIIRHTHNARNARFLRALDLPAINYSLPTYAPP